MTLQALAYINDRLTEAGINYHFMRYNFGQGDPEYPYSVGSYSENDDAAEDGGQSATFTVNAWTRGTWMELERVKATIKALFPVTGATAILEDGSGLVVSYVRSQPIPTGDEELKRIEIILTVKEWSE